MTLTQGSPQIPDATVLNARDLRRVYGGGGAAAGQVVALDDVSVEIEPGEIVVVSAQFLIDSESKLREAAAKMQEANP